MSSRKISERSGPASSSPVCSAFDCACCLSLRASGRVCKRASAPGKRARVWLRQPHLRHQRAAASAPHPQPTYPQPSWQQQQQQIAGQPACVRRAPPLPSQPPPAPPPSRPSSSPATSHPAPVSQHPLYIDSLVLRTLPPAPSHSPRLPCAPRPAPSSRRNQSREPPAWF